MHVAHYAPSSDTGTRQWNPHRTKRSHRLGYYPPGILQWNPHRFCLTNSLQALEPSEYIPMDTCSPLISPCLRSYLYTFPPDSDLTLSLSPTDQMRSRVSAKAHIKRLGTHTANEAIQHARRYKGISPIVMIQIQTCRASQRLRQIPSFQGSKILEQGTSHLRNDNESRAKVLSISKAQSKGEFL